MRTCKLFLPFNVARARAVQDELIDIGFRETDLAHLVTVHHDVLGTVQSQASDVERIVLASRIPPGVACLGSNRVAGLILGGGRLVGNQPMEGLHVAQRYSEKVKIVMLTGVSSQTNFGEL